MPTIAPASSFVIVGTRYCTPRGSLAYYEVDVAADHEPDAKRVTLVTRDDVLTARALLLEGTESRVTLTWRQVRGPRGPRLMLEVADVTRTRLDASYRHGLRVRIGPHRDPGKLLHCESKRASVGKYWSIKLDAGGWVFPDDSLLVDGPGEIVGTCAQCQLPYLMPAGSGELLCAGCHVDQFGDAVTRAGDPPPQRRWNTRRRWNR